jgi:hypothetical protein
VVEGILFDWVCGEGRDSAVDKCQQGPILVASGAAPA